MKTNIMGRTNIIKRAAAVLTLALCVLTHAEADGLFNYNSAAKKEEGSCKVLDTSATVEIDLNNYLEKIRSAFNSTFDENTNKYCKEVAYMHWYFTDASGNVTGTNGNPLITMNDNSFSITPDQNGNKCYNYNTSQISGSNGLFYCGYIWNENNHGALFSEYKHLKYTITKPTDKKWTEIKAVCVLDGENYTYTKNNNSAITAVTAERNSPMLALVFSFTEVKETDFNPFADITSVTKLNKVIALAKGSVNADQTIKLGDYQNDIPATISSTILSKTKYFHWYLVKKGTSDEIVKNLTSGTFASSTTKFDLWSNATIIEGPNGYFFTCESNQGYLVGNLTFTLKNTVGSDWSAYKAVCVVSDDLTGIELFSGKIMTEPTNLKLAFIFDFQKEFASDMSNCTTANDAVTLTGSETADAAFKYSIENKTVTINLTKNTANSTLSNFINQSSKGVKYLRWYFEKDGKAVAAPEGITLSGSGLKAAPQTEYGNYWYSSTAATTALDGISISGSAIRLLSGYKLVCAMSKDATDIDATDDGVTTEPTWSNTDLKYTMSFTFNTPFSIPTLATGGLEVPVKLNSSVNNGNYTVSLETQSSKDDYSKTNTLSLLNKITGKSAITENTLNTSGYIRWYMVDNNNNLVKMTAESDNSYKWKLAPSSNGYSPLGSYSNYSWSGEYNDKIFRWNPDKKELDNALIPKNLYSTVDPSTSGNKLICEIAYNNTGTITDEGIGVNEFDDGFYQLRYVFHFDDIFIAKNADSDEYTTKSKTVVLNKYAGNANTAAFTYDVNAQKVTIDLTKADGASDAGLTSGVRYARWYFVDKDGKVVENPTDITLTVPNGVSVQDPASYGQYVYLKSAATTGISNVVISGSASSLAKCSLVCVMSTDAKNVVESVLHENEVTTEPDYTLKYVISFAEDNDDFIAFNSFDASGYVSKSTMVALGKDTEAFKYSESSGTGTLTVNLTKDENVKEQKLDSGVKYVRWFVIDDDNKIVENSGLTISAANGTTLTAKSGYGSYWYSSAKGTSALDGITVSGTKENLLKYRLACVLSEDDTYINVSGNEVLHEPDWDMYYVISMSEYTQFLHYKGYAYTHDGYKNGTRTIMLSDGDTWEAGTKGSDGKMKYQEVHEWDYDIYVEGKSGETVNLVLPFGIFSKGESKEWDVLEPCGYLRWYDYNTDQLSSDLVLNKDTHLQTYSVGSLLYNGIRGNESDITYQKEAVVAFKVPSDSWTGTDIACDVSRYIDGGTTADGKTLLREPTLSIRYIFHVHPATDIADSLKNAIINSDYKRPFEYHGYTTLGVKDKNSEANLRANLSEIDKYYFYDYSHSLKSVDGNSTPTFGSQLFQATKFVWYVFDVSGKYYKQITGNERLVGVSIESVSGDFTSLDGGSGKNIQFNVGDAAYICGYLADNNNHMCPFSEYIVRFLEEYPIMYSDITDEKNTERSPAWMAANYTPVVELNFDEDSEGANLNAPTNPLDNMTQLPSKWGNRFNGFVYPGLYDYICASNNTNGWGGLGCLHNEYGLYKTANLSGISAIGNNNTYNSKGYNYGWYVSNKLYDRTYETTGQYGYFLYSDASVESRKVAQASFDANLCAGNSFIFTIAVADMTNGDIKPQLMFHLYGATKDDATGEYVKENLIHSFCTCDISTVVTGLTTGTWYQVYAKVILQQNTGVENYEHFILEVDNYGKATNGNDYAIDDIRIYQSNTNILATQDAPVCPDDEVGNVTFKIPHDGIVAKFGNTEQWATKKLRWQIRKRSDNSVVKEISVKDGTTAIKGYVEGKDYGEVTVYRNRSDISGSLISGINNKTEKARYQTINNTLYLVLAEKVELPVGEYYISASLQTAKGNADAATKDDDFTTPGTPDDKCSVYSDYFTLSKQELSIKSGSTTSGNNIIKDCKTGALKTIKTNSDGTQTETPGATIDATMTVPDPINGGTTKVNNALYDWYIGSKAEYGKEEEGALYTALTNFRAVKAYKYVTVSADANGNISAKDQSGNSVTVSTSGDFKDVDWTALQKAVTDGKLYMGYSEITLTNLQSENSKTQYFYLMPLAQEIEISYTKTIAKVMLCIDPQELSLNVATDGPELNLGFADVTYPAPAGYRAVRLGLDHHINKMTNGTQLRLPVHDAKHKGTVNKGEFRLKPGAGAKVFISASNDPTWNATLTNTAVVAGTVEDVSAYYVNIKFKSLENGLAFHEGYWYDADFSIYDSNDETKNANDETKYCTGDVFFRLKIVPEYVTWTAAADASKGSTNWNNDENWTRSTKKELYKTVYDNNGEGDLKDIPGGADQIKTYVPMKFTKVTVPKMSNFSYAYLTKMEKKSNGILKDECMSNADHYAATDYIQYDIMVKMDADTDDENGSGSNPNEEAYGCEKFYGNTCEQIYFKPEAELRQQQYLDYTKAWVEKELEADKWYMLASPLRDTYAGDMYVPVANGRQETEAFTPITFSTAGGYSRNTAPIYQRSWDRSDVSTMTVNDNGKLKTPDANISYGDWSTATPTSLLTSNWSHVYNEMAVKYYDADGTAPRYGFSVRAGNANTTALGDSTTWMVRLPKADTSYDYYYQNDKTDASTSKATETLDKTGLGLLLIDQNNYNTVNEFGVVKQKLVNATTGNGLYLVSNPYMKTLDMGKFFDMNPGLEKKYWTVQNGEVRAATADVVTLKSNSGKKKEGKDYWPSIKPMESFFVKVAEGSEVSEVTFNTNITSGSPYVYKLDNTDGGAATQTTATQSNTRRYQTRTGYTQMPVQSLSMTATNASGRSTASVVVRETADAGFVADEDVETLYDSNIADVPTLYTVAGSEAVSINALPEIKMLPVGVVSSADGDATVTITGAQTLDRNMYLYDAVTGKSTALGDTTTVTMKANAHGRYYITSTLPDPSESDEVSGVRCYSPQPGVLVVSSPTENLVQIDVYGIDGSAVKRIDTGSVNSVSVNLPRSIYIVKARTTGRTATVKLRVN